LGQQDATAPQFFDNQCRQRLRITHGGGQRQRPDHHGVERQAVESTQVEPGGQFGEVGPPGLVAPGVSGECVGFHVELSREVVEQGGGRHLISLQHATGMAQTDEHRLPGTLEAMLAAPNLLH
jgi:hypothetical protein